MQNKQASQTADDIIEQSQEAWDDAKSTGREFLKDIKSKSKDLWKDVANRSGEGWEEVRGYVQKKPERALGIALLVGVVAGALIFTRSRE